MSERGPSPISAVRMVAMLSLVLGRAEAHRDCGEAPGDALERALRDHTDAFALVHEECIEIVAVCRNAWRIMSHTGGQEPDERPSVAVPRELFRETLERLGYLQAVRAEMTRTSKDRPEHNGALRHVLCFVPTGSCSDSMCRLIDAFHAYATVVHDTTGTPPAVRDLVEALLVMAVR